MTDWQKSTIRGLVISRKVGEKISVNQGEIEIEVIDIRGRLVRLAFKAHKEIKINRAEAIAEEAVLSVSER